jgi:hypothetical protein
MFWSPTEFIMPDAVSQRRGDGFPASGSRLSPFTMNAPTHGHATSPFISIP